MGAYVFITFDKCMDFFFLLVSSPQEALSEANSVITKSGF